MSSFFRVDVSELHGVGSDLTETAARLASAQKYDDVPGAAGYADLSSAVSTFTNAWSTCLRAVEIDIAALGQAAQGISRTVSATDMDQAQGWRGTGHGTGRNELP